MSSVSRLTRSFIVKSKRIVQNRNFHSIVGINLRFPQKSHQTLASESIHQKFQSG